MDLTLDQSSLITLQAFVVGMIGSFAYYVALRLGYVVGADVKLFETRMIAVFCVIGGCIAAIFQLPELTTFAPIQALVLGITWPTLIGQYVASAGEAAKNKEFVDLLRGPP